LHCEEVIAMARNKKGKQNLTAEKHRLTPVRLVKIITNAAKKKLKKGEKERNERKREADKRNKKGQGPAGAGRE